MDVMVYEISKPKRKAWQMTETGYERLTKDFPGKYAIFQQLQSVQKAQKKSLTVVVEPISDKEFIDKAYKEMGYEIEVVKITPKEIVNLNQPNKATEGTLPKAKRGKAKA